MIKKQQTKMTHDNEPIDNMEEVISNNLPQLLADDVSTHTIYQTLWEIYESEYDADEERDGRIFTDMVGDTLEYGIL